MAQGPLTVRSIVERGQSHGWHVITEGLGMVCIGRATRRHKRRVGEKRCCARIDAEVVQNLGLDVIESLAPRRALEAERAAATVAQIDDDAGPIVDDELECALQLGVTVASKRTKYVAGQAFSVHMNRNAIGGCQVAVDKGDVFAAVRPVAISHSREFPLGQR
jgi:hypothetical protein